MILSRADSFKEAMRLLYSGHAVEALSIGRDLLIQPDEAYQLSGHLCVGLVFEEGGPGLLRDLDLATLHYHKAAIIAKDSLTFCYLARATMKKGGEHYDAALSFLEEARKRGNPAEVLLGFALYYQTKKDPDTRLAKRYYLYAALRGRFAGFFGYSALSRELGQYGRAFAVDVIRIVSGPVLALLLGSAAQDQF